MLPARAKPNRDLPRCCFRRSEMWLPLLGNGEPEMFVNVFALDRITAL
jgi:hypothetical protein